MREFFPFCRPEESSRNDIIHLLSALDNPVVQNLFFLLFEPPMQILIEHIEPVQESLEIDVGGLSMQQQLMGIIHIHTSVIEHPEHGSLVSEVVRD